MSEAFFQATRLNTVNAPAALLEHGGRLRAASQRFGIPLQDWLDLSTGINPLAYPVPSIDAETWRCLPEDDDALLEAARTYYGTSETLAVPGSQAALQLLPRLVPTQRVAMLRPSYAEHAHHWRHAGHTLVYFDDPMDLATACRAGVVDSALLVNPNNPTGHAWAREDLLALHASLSARGGLLVVDEAFLDCTPERSLAAWAHRPGLVVLRSLGKFFGLAGARVGFVLACAAVRDALRAALGPWPLSGPSRFVATAALRDASWQAHTRRQLDAASTRLAGLLQASGLGVAAGPALFQWCAVPEAASLHRTLAEAGILTRLFDAPTSLRFGLPGSEMQWQRLEQASVRWHGNAACTNLPGKHAR